MGKIADGAVMPITQEQWPKTFAAWGENGVKRISILMQPAAEIAASSPECDTLELLGFSDKRSSAPDIIVFYADCANGKRFFVTEEDVLTKRKVVTQGQKYKWLGDQQLIEISQKAVKARLGRPCSFSSAMVYRAAVGRTVVTVQSCTVNDAGANITIAAKCYFDALSLTEGEMNLG